MRSKHIQIAHEDGAKAGFNFYMTNPTPKSIDRIEEILDAGNRRDQFGAYCALFTDDLPNARAQVRSDEQVQEVRHEASSRIADAKARFGKAEARAKSTRTTTPPKARTTNDEPLSKDSEFVYHSKGGNISTWTVEKVNSKVYVCSNGKRTSNWKKSTVASLIAKGTVEVV